MLMGPFRSTSASIIRKYLPEGLPDQRIDFCHYIDPTTQPKYAAKIESLRQELPEASINHTSYTALLGCPTTGSIETKRHGENFDGAVLQIAVWQAAQWKMLRVLLHKAILRRRVRSTASLSQDVFVDSKDVAQELNESLRSLGSIHGIYTQGHEWYYFATSPEIVDAQGKPSLKTVRCISNYILPSANCQLQGVVAIRTNWQYTFGLWYSSNRGLS